MIEEEDLIKTNTVYYEEVLFLSKKATLDNQRLILNFHSVIAANLPNEIQIVSLKTNPLFYQ